MISPGFGSVISIALTMSPDFSTGSILVRYSRHQCTQGLSSTTYSSDDLNTHTTKQFATKISDKNVDPGFHRCSSYAPDKKEHPDPSSCLRASYSKYSVYCRKYTLLSFADMKRCCNVLALRVHSRHMRSLQGYGVSFRGSGGHKTHNIHQMHQYFIELRA